MRPHIRVDLEKIVRDGSKPLIIELGCGEKKRPGRISIDKVDLSHVDIVADIENGLPFLPGNSVDEIHCRSVLEHIQNFENLVREMVRVLKKDGKAHIFVPHFSNPYYYSDYTHKRPFGLYSFYYFVEAEHQLRRKVPTFYTDVRIEIVSQRLVFRSPFWLSRRIKKAIGYLFNCHRVLTEFYEQHLCYIFPCDGIEIVFTPADAH
ncbi:MAG: methyltransferase domain-containing protein [Phycisphaerales bacterium]|nr:MAG: methyltransferase domain-containing protein [Phycisphaerales bacterium]